MQVLIVDSLWSLNNESETASSVYSDKSIRVLRVYSMYNNAMKLFFSYMRHAPLTITLLVVAEQRLEESPRLGHL